jgi:hypothetical protein
MAERIEFTENIGSFLKKSRKQVGDNNKLKNKLIKLNLK